MVSALAKVTTSAIKTAPKIKPKPTGMRSNPITSNPASVNKNLANNPLASKSTGNASGPPLPPRKPVPDKSQANLDRFNREHPPTPVDQLPKKPHTMESSVPNNRPKTELPPRSMDTSDLVSGKPVPPKGEFIPEGKLWSKNLESKMPQTPKSGWQKTKNFVTSPLGGALTGTVGGSLLVMGGSSAYEKMKGGGGEAAPADGGGAMDPAASGSADSAGGYDSYGSSYDPYGSSGSYGSDSGFGTGYSSGYGTGYGANSFYA